MIRGGLGSDLLIGAGRADVLSGGPDNDLLRAVDGLRDLRVDGDGGRDTAYHDRGRDLPAGDEVLHPRGG